MSWFSHDSVIFTVIQNEWLATNSQNAILNNFEENFKRFTAKYFVMDKALSGELSCTRTGLVANVV